MDSIGNFVTMIALMTILGIICLGVINHQEAKINQEIDSTLAKEEQKIQSILNEKGDTLIAYLEGKKIDWKKIDLNYYHIRFNDDFSEMYLTKKESKPIIINNGYSMPHFIYVPRL